MMFQSYALWPHMTVKQNVAFGLKVRKVETKELNRRVDEALEQVQMTPYANRKPNQLSGGQQQRVALARAMVIEPTVLLLDEPLSNLDAKLRLEMRTQIREICHAAKITTVYVTHDQKEALSIADGMAVLKDGEIIQVGEPRRLYDRPCNRFVANFLGETNFIPAQIIGRQDGAVVLDSPLGKLHSTAYVDNLPQTGNVTCSIRPEAINVAKREPDSAFVNQFHAKQQQSIFLGELAQHQLTIDDLMLKCFELNPRQPKVNGADVKLQVASQDVVILSD
jgi:iron(III) transport system ATP-binding protein